MNDVNAALRMLADAGPREAPDHVETALKDSFRRHRRALRLRRGIVIAIAAGSAAASIAVFTTIPQPAAPPQRIAFHIAPPAITPCGAGTSSLWTRAGHACRAETSGLRIPGLRVRAGRAGRLGAPARKPTRRPRTDQLATTEFVPLPYGDDALIDESARIVRVELPRSALRMAGFNVAQERANERVQADVLLGADGLAHAVRFVRYTE